MTQPAEDLPAYAVDRASMQALAGARPWPARVTREWALGDSTGRGARVCVVDSGIEAGHPAVGRVDTAVVVSISDDEVVVEPDTLGDVCGHGTACAGIIREIAPECELWSVRVLGSGFTGSGAALLGGLRWAVAEGFDVINMSLSTTKRRFVEALHDLTDAAYFQRSIVVASAHNMPVASYPWRFSSVISVGSHEEADPMTFFYNPSPPVEFFARGVGVEIAWLGGGTILSTGNSFATPHITGICALIRAKHPDLTPAEVKTLLGLTAANAEPPDG